MMSYAIAGASVMDEAPVNYLLKMQHHPANKLTGASFTKVKNKSLLDRLIDFLRQEGNP